MMHAPAAPTDDRRVEIEQEIELLRRIAEKDHHSFSQLYTRFFGVIFGTVQKVISDPSDAEDVTQDVFIQIWNKANLYQPEKGRPLTWVATMARNRAIDYIRSKQRRARLRDDFEEESSSQDLLMENDSSDLTSRAERFQIVRDALDELTPDQREAIELAYFKDQTQAEVAKQLDRPLGTIKARIRRGTMRLREVVEDRL